MSIQITNTSTHLVITNNGNVRSNNKQLVREVSVLRGVTLKIDIGGGALRNIFLPIADITLPVHANPNELVDAVNTLLSPIEVSLGQDLEHLGETLTAISERVNNMLPASMQEPSFIDESNPHVIYSGFAGNDATPDQPAWAIMRTTIQDDVIVNEWAGGSQAMSSVWNDRSTLAYS